MAILRMLEKIQSELRATQEELRKGIAGIHEHLKQIDERLCTQLDQIERFEATFHEEEDKSRDLYFDLEEPYERLSADEDEDAREGDGEF